MVAPRPSADAEGAARVELANDKGWLVVHESGTFVRLADAGAATVHRASTTI